MTDQRDPPSYGAIKQLAIESLGEYSDQRDIKEWLKALARFVPNLIIIEEGYVQLDQTPDIIIEQIIATISEMHDPTIGEDIIKAIKQ